MYRDKSLLPAEAARLAALGSLAVSPKPYAALARELRWFSGALIGPSLDLLGGSIELMRVEGLIDADGSDEDAPLRPTERGRKVLLDLLAAPLKTPINDVGRVIVALKLRFLDLLPVADQPEQIELLVDALEGDRARLVDLQTRLAHEPSALDSWLDLEIASLDQRLDWLTARHAQAS